MPKICHTPKTFREAGMEMIDHANRIIGEYRRQGFKLTLRRIREVPGSDALDEDAAAMRAAHPDTDNVDLGERLRRILNNNQ